MVAVCMWFQASQHLLCACTGAFQVTYLDTFLTKLALQLSNASFQFHLSPRSRGLYDVKPHHHNNGCC